MLIPAWLDEGEDTLDAGTSGGDWPRRLDMVAIESALSSYQLESLRINRTLSSAHQPPSCDVLQNMLDAYVLIDRWLAQRLDLFSMGNSHLLLEINRTVLYGRHHATERQISRQMRLDEEHFYGNVGSHVGNLLGWYDRHAHLPVLRLAAGLHVQILSAPELFVEGNHRSSTILMSYVCLQAGLAPLVLSAGNAAEFFRLTPAIQALDKRRPLLYLHRRKLVRQVKAVLPLLQDTACLLPEQR